MLKFTENSLIKAVEDPKNNKKYKDCRPVNLTA
jgi:hypothetical protein